MKTNKGHVAAKDLIENPASRGRYSFTSEEAREALKVSADASKLALNRLVKQGQIASPARGEIRVSPPDATAIDLADIPYMSEDSTRLRPSFQNWQKKSTPWR